MEKKIKSKIKKWDEVAGATDEDEATENGFDEVLDGPAIIRNPMRKNEEIIEEEQKKKSVLEIIKEKVPEPEKSKPLSLCPDRELC